MTLLLYYLLGLIESLCKVAIGSSLLGVHIKREKLVVISLVLFIACQSIREIYAYLNIPLGTHSFLIILVESILLVKIGKLKFNKAAVAVLLSYLILIIIENITIFNIFMIFKFDMLTETNLAIKNLALLITDIPMLILFYFSYIKRFSIINMNKEAD